MIDTKTRICIAKSRNIADSGEWISLPFTDDELEELLQKIGITTSEGETEYDLFMNGNYEDSSYLIVDYETDCEFLKINPDTDINGLNDLVDGIEALNDNDYETLAAIIEADGGDISDAISSIKHGDCEWYPSTNLTELAERFAGEEMFSNEYLLAHVDYEAIGSDLSDDGYTETNGGVLYRR